MLKKITLFLRSKCCVLGSRDSFTIVELLVSIGLFSVIISIAIGGFVRALRAQRQIVALINANSNISLVVEQMVREIRTGYNFCPGDAPCENSTLNFSDAKGDPVTYTLEPSENGLYEVIKRNDAQITADNVNVHYLNFTRLPEADRVSFPERITLNIGISPTAASAPVVSDIVTNIQTTISARNF